MRRLLKLRQSDVRQGKNEKILVLKIASGLGFFMVKN